VEKKTMKKKIKKPQLMLKINCMKKWKKNNEKKDKKAAADVENKLYEDAFRDFFISKCL
jgi:hypothetical protein